MTCSLAQSSGLRAIAAGTVAFLLVGGCSDVPIEASPPYACQVIPVNVFDTALSDDPSQSDDTMQTIINDGDFDSGYFSCTAEKDQYLVIYHQWQGAKQVTEGRKAMLSWEDKDAGNVPPEMGEGRIDSPLSSGWVHWRCGDQPVLSQISYPFVSDRDRRADILRLLEIAQQRYAELNDCEIRPTR